MSASGSKIKVQLLEPYWPILRDYRYVGYHGGRGSGKSTNVGRAFLLKGLRSRRRILCCREFQNSIRESVHQLLCDEIDAMGLGDYYTVAERTIVCKDTGTDFIFAGLRHGVNSIKSMQGLTDVWVEEAQTISQRSLDILIPTVRAEGSMIVFTWNPYKPTDPVDVLLRGDDTAHRAYVREVNFSENPYFPDVLREEMERTKERDPGKYKHVWLGQYMTESEALVFRNWRIEPCEPPAKADLRFGADWGFAKDPTVALRCWRDEKAKLLYVDHEAYQVGCRIEDTPRLFNAIPDIARFPLIADSARPETIDYMRRHGFPRIEAAKKGKDSIKEGIKFLQDYDIVVHPRCKHLIAELGSYSYKQDPLTGQILPDMIDDDNHCVDSLRYACEAWRRPNFNWAAFS